MSYCKFAVFFIIILFVYVVIVKGPLPSGESEGTYWFQIIYWKLIMIHAFYNILFLLTSYSWWAQLSPILYINLCSYWVSSFKHPNHDQQSSILVCPLLLVPRSDIYFSCSLRQLRIGCSKLIIHFGVFNAGNTKWRRWEITKSQTGVWWSDMWGCRYSNERDKWV